jgi:outer membrane receptor protein involved in Fe transport
LERSRVERDHADARECGQAHVVRGPAQPTAAAPDLPSTLLDDLSLWNFRLNWDSPAEIWSAALTVTNLTDEFYYESQFGNGLATNFSITRRPGWPREVFLTMKRRFD